MFVSELVASRKSIFLGGLLTIPSSVPVDLLPTCLIRQSRMVWFLVERSAPKTLDCTVAIRLIRHCLLDFTLAMETVLCMTLALTRLSLCPFVPVIVW